MIKALFDIQKIHVDGSKIYYELFYKGDNNQYTKVIEACFFSIPAAGDYINDLIEAV